MIFIDPVGTDRVTRLHEDRDHNLWIGTYGGLNRLTKGVITAITRDEGLGDDIVTAISVGTASTTPRQDQGPEDRNTGCDLVHPNG